MLDTSEGGFHVGHLGGRLGTCKGGWVGHLQVRLGGLHVGHLGGRLGCWAGG